MNYMADLLIVLANRNAPQTNSQADQMGRNISLRIVLGSIVGLLALLLIGITTYNVLEALSQRQVARVIERGNETSDLLLLAAGHFAAERGMTNAALNAAQSARDEDRASIRQRRDEGDRALQAALAVLNTQDVHKAQASEIESTHARVRELRQAADAALSQAREARDRATVSAWVPAATKLIEVSQRLRLAADYEADAAEARLADLQRLKHFIWVISEFAGRERAALGGIIAAGRPLTADDLQRLAGFRGQVELAWSLVEAYAAKASAPAEVRQAAAEVRRAMFDEFQATRESVYRAGASGSAYPVTGAEWIAASTRAIEVVLKLSRSAGQATARIARDTATQRSVALSTAGGILLLGFAVTTLSFWVMSRRIATPLQTMTATTSALADGKTDVVIPALERGDEIGVLANAIEVFRQKLIENDRLAAEKAARDQIALERARMLEQLTSRFDRNVSTLARALAGAAKGMETTAQSMTATADQTNNNSIAVAGAVEQTSASVQTVASATEQMSGSIHEIGRQMTRSSTIATKAVDDAGKTDAKVQELAAGAEKIGNIVSLINALAAQTNLLALNATIEAARAGESGRGFAVVASEVKALAAETAKATEEIAAQVKDIQAATSETVAAIQGISTTIAEMAKISNGIAAAIEEQGAATREISHNVSEVARATEQVGHNINEVKQGAGETRTAATQVLGAAQELARHSDNLTIEVQKFLSEVQAA
jgi:methyl-accepting chemotaxis protein